MAQVCVLAPSSVSPFGLSSLLYIFKNWVFYHPAYPHNNFTMSTNLLVSALSDHSYNNIYFFSEEVRVFPNSIKGPLVGVARRPDCEAPRGKFLILGCMYIIVIHPSCRKSSHMEPLH